MAEKYIIRTQHAGVFYGEIASRNGGEADLCNVRRIWQWSGASECIQLAMEGCAPSSKITMPANEITVLGVIEIHPVTEAAQAKFDAVPIWKA